MERVPAFKRELVFAACLTASCILGAAPASAALAPNYQRLAEMRAILDSSALADVFDVRHPVERIEYLGPDHYRASGGGCRLELRLVSQAMPDGMVGPRRFSIRAGKPVCQ